MGFGVCLFRCRWVLGSVCSAKGGGGGGGGLFVQLKGGGGGGGGGIGLHHYLKLIH